MDEGLKLEGLMMVLLGEVVMNVKLVMEMAWMMRLTIEEIVKKIVLSGWVHIFRKSFLGPNFFDPKLSRVMASI